MEDGRKGETDRPLSCPLRSKVGLVEEERAARP